jgi:hypothetical protein
MPSLATRYRVIEEADQHESASTKRIILLNKYIDALVTHRAKDGVLGINCHISHLIYLDALIEKAKIKNPKLRIYKDYLHRHDKYSQAASYAIAKQTRIWSTKRKSKEIATSQLNRLKLCIKAARCYKNLVAQDQLGLRGRLENDYGSILAYETDIQTNITETAAKIVSTLHLTKLATIQSDFRSLERQASSLNGEIATRIREHMAVFLFLGLLDRPLGKVATMVVSIFKRLGAEKAPPKLRFWLEISNP